MMGWGVLDPEEITDEQRRICDDLIYEELRDRERGFWDVGIDPGYNGKENQ